MLVVILFIHDLVEFVVIHTSCCNTLATETKFHALVIEIHKMDTAFLSEGGCKEVFKLTCFEDKPRSSWNTITRHFVPLSNICAPLKGVGLSPEILNTTKYSCTKRGNKHTLTKLQAVYLYTYWPACTGRISSLLSLYYLLVVA